MLLWLICGSAFLLALVAVHRVRALSRRLDRVKQLQWELSYQVDRLTARLEGGAQDPAGTEPDPPAPGPGQDRARPAFVPLSSLRR